MTIVEKGDVYIMNHCDRDAALRSFYFIKRVGNQEACDALVITFWRYSLPTLYSTSGPEYKILQPPVMGSIEQGTRDDWFKALWTMFVGVKAYTENIIEEVKE